MTKSDIQSHLSKKYRDFVDQINALTEEEFGFSKNGKWTAGQQLLHIYLGIKPLASILQSLESLTKSNGHSRAYDDIVREYLKLLEIGAMTNATFAPTVGTPFDPGIVKFKDRTDLTNKLMSSIDKLCSNIEKLSEQQLDDFYIAHPLLRNLTIREMMCFTIYHVEHHHKQIRPNLKL